MASVLTINGRRYIERYQDIVFETAFTVANQVKRDQRLSLPGQGPFLAKALKGTTLLTATGVPAVRRYKFKFGNTDGGIWYSTQGLGGTNDRVVDTMIVGTAQFPKIFTPPILYQSNAAILMEFESLVADVDFTVYLSFEGSLLFPAPEGM